MKNKIVFIINPIAGKGKGRAVAAEIQNFFAAENVEIELYLTEKEGHATELTTAALALHPDVIVACGGDGTINEIARQLAGTETALGIIPIGSGNGLAAHLNIPKKTQDAMRTILNLNSGKIDAGIMNGNYFFSNIGFGIDAETIFHYSRKKKRSFFGYLSAGIKAVVCFQPKKFKVTVNGFEKSENAYYFLFCSNSNEAGYGISFSPHAKLNDGKLDLLTIKKLNFIKQLKFSLCVLNKSVEKLREAEITRVQSVKLQSGYTRILAQIDGETVFLNQGDIEISVAPNALKVLIPKLDG